MKKVIKHLTVPNVLSTIALFFVLGGVSYGATALKKNSVAAKQIKKGSVTNAKIAKNAVATSKIKNGAISADKIAGTIGPAKVDVASLGKFAAAGTADTVETSAASIVKRLSPSVDNPSTSTAMSLATEVPIASNGQVSVYNKCFTSSGTLYSYLFLKTTADGAISSSNGGGSPFYGNPYLNVATNETNRSLYSVSAGTGSSYYGSNNYYEMGTLVGPNGDGLNFQLYQWVKNGNLFTGSGAFAGNQVCVITGTATKLSLG